MQINRRFMDKFFSIFSFPIGLLLCFWPALVVWLKEELAENREEKPGDRR